MIPPRPLQRPLNNPYNVPFSTTPPPPVPGTAAPPPPSPRMDAATRARVIAQNQSRAAAARAAAGRAADFVNDTTTSRAGAGAKSALSRAAARAAPAARSVAARVAPALAGMTAAAGRAATAPISATAGAKTLLGRAALPGAVYTIGEVTGINDALANTSVAQRAQKAVVDFAGKMTGLNDYQERLQNDVSMAARDYPQVVSTRYGGTMADAPAADAAAEPSAVAAAPKPASPQTAEELAVLENSAPASDTLNANRPMAIPGSDRQYAGRYGGTEVLRRDVTNRQGENVAEFAQQGEAAPYDAAAEAQRVAQARADYAANTTMSDGTRAFGGAGSESLQRARLAAIARGEGDVVERQLAEESMTPAQRQAYRQDPLEAYKTDRTTAAAESLAAYKGFKDATTGMRADRTESRQAREGAMKSVDAQLKLLAENEGVDGATLGILKGLIAQEYDAGGGAESIDQVYARVLGGLPRDKETGALDMQAFLSQQIAQEQQTPGATGSFLDRWLN